MTPTCAGRLLVRARCAPTVLTPEPVVRGAAGICASPPARSRHPRQARRCRFIDHRRRHGRLGLGCGRLPLPRARPARARSRSRCSAAWRSRSSRSSSAARVGHDRGSPPRGRREPAARGRANRCGRPARRRWCQVGRIAAALSLAASSLGQQVVAAVAQALDRALRLHGAAPSASGEHQQPAAQARVQALDVLGQLGAELLGDLAAHFRLAPLDQLLGGQSRLAL